MDNNKKNLMLMVPMLHQGGFERVCIKTARLMQDYYNVYILIFSSKDINFDITGLEVIDIDVPAKKGVVNKVINVFKRVRKTRKIKKDLKIDICYSFGGSANYVNTLSKGKERVLTGLRCQTDMENPKQVRLFCSRSTQVLSCSREIVRQLKADFDYDRSTYIYNPLDVEDVQRKGAEPIDDFPFGPQGRSQGTKTDDGKNEPMTPSPGTKIKVIADMARNDYIKGIWHLVKAVAIVAKSHPEVRLVVLGAGNWDKYRQLAKDLGIEDKVAFPGLRKNPFPYVAAADLYVCSSNHEGFPNAVLEAMALHKSVISADCKTGPREILLSDDEYNKLIEEIPDGSSPKEPIQGSFGILVPDMDENENFDPNVVTEGEKMLAKEIARMLDDEELMQSYADKAYERALFYTPEKYAGSIHEILKRYE
ncbi:MAG: glycosyltransferase [Butyrivibrio sp.]|nr:glycosyltransferase [Butyrivibrio sp.]